MIDAPTEEHGEVIPPNPARLLESIRGFGYSLPCAIADLIDNSLAANASHIAVEVDLLSSAPHIAVIDNGRGMTDQQLVEAMRMGADCGSASRSPHDLGRFGLGLKSASLSQGRILTVVSKTKSCSGPNIRQWNIEHVAKSGRWELLRAPGSSATSYLDRFDDQTPCGTAVIIESLDRVAANSLASAAGLRHAGSILDAIRLHLEMTFHRFINERDVVIRLGGADIPGWDPFLSTHAARQPTERFPVGDAMIEVQPFLLPHHSKIDADTHDRAAGPEGWLKHQGFYVYRCGRLIVPGGWLGLGFRQTDQTRLVRIMVDLPNSIDEMWQLNVMKSRVAVPGFLRDDFRRIAEDLCRSARRVYGYRGERAAPEPDSPRKSIWRRRTVGRSVSYRIDRSHPVVASLIGCESSNVEIIENVLRLIERSIPIAAILQESQASLDGAVDEFGAEESGMLDELVQFAIQHFVRCGLSPDSARERVFSAAPFRDLRHRIDAGLTQQSDGGENG